MSPELHEKLKILMEYLEDSGLLIGGEKSIPYGHQVQVRRFQETVQVCLYHGKKGFSFLLQGPGSELKSELQQELELVFHGKTQEPVSESEHEIHCGSDESGKGDYFGPLTCACVFVDAATESRLKALGVDDSKKITDARILRMAEEIRRLGPSVGRVLVLKPQKYNELYAKFTAQKKNLNHLLSWMHATLIRDMGKIHSDLKKAYVDQFAKNDGISPLVHKEYPHILVHQETKAESRYIAVAAASILARAELIRWHKEMEEEGMPLPFGAGGPVTKKARELVASQGAQVLESVAKLHFKTTQEVLG